MKVAMADRKSRGMDLEGIIDLLRRAPVGRVATISTDGTPYVVPVNFAFEEDSIYFHCALEGMKLDNIGANPKVGFETDELVGIYVSHDRPCACGCHYRSAIARGRAGIVSGREEKLRALRLLADKYAGGKSAGKMSDASIDATCVVRIDISEISGKAHLPR